MMEYTEALAVHLENHNKGVRPKDSEYIENWIELDEDGRWIDKKTKQTISVDFDEMKNGEWEVEPEELFVYGTTDNCNDKSCLFLKTPVFDKDTGRWDSKFGTYMTVGKNIFQKNVINKFKLTLIEDE